MLLLQLMVGDEVLDVAETDVSGDHHFMYVRHRGFIQVRRLWRLNSTGDTSLLIRAHLCPAMLCKLAKSSNLKTH